MKLQTALLLGAATTALAAPRPVDSELGNIPQIYLDNEQGAATGAQTANEKFLIELAPGETKWITEDEKWALRREGINFIDITEHQDGLIPPIRAANAPLAGNVVFPERPAHVSSIKPLLSQLSEAPMKENLVKFSSFHTRYYKSQYGAQSSKWLQGKVEDVIKAAGADQYGATVVPFPHSWGQNSIIAQIPGKSNTTVVIGAHQDSINLWLPNILPAPGADDDGSGSVTILEALRVLLTDKNILTAQSQNTLEFHWYSAEEGGLLGSQDIFSAYAAAGRDVRAMLQQDMTGYVEKTLQAGKPESVGVITDFVDSGLSSFIEKVITQYCDIPYVRTECGYACSDHASAAKAGYPSAFVIEADMKLTSDKIHTQADTIDTISFPHMLQHAKLTLGLAYELANAELPVKGKN